MNIYLIGFMGTGKSTVGKALAERIGWPHVDMDEEIAKREGRSIPRIFEEDGESRFRDLETELLTELSRQNGLLVTTGGGIVIRPGNRELMRKTGYVISLFADKETIRERVSRQGGRPLLAGGELDRRIDRLLVERKGLYDDADIRIDTSGRDEAAIVGEIAGHPSFPVR